MTGAVNLGGTTTLRSVDEDAALAISTSGGTVSGDLVLEESGGDGISISSSGPLSVSGGVSGAVNLALAGAGAKTFSGTVNVGSGRGASLSIGGEAVSFAGLTTAGGITSSSALTFNNSVNLDTAGTGTTLLTVAVTLGGVNFNSGGAVGMTGPITLTGDSTLTGVGTYDITGTITGAGRALTLSGTGNKSFSNTMNLASISQTGSAATGFSGNVNLSDGADFAGGVTLAGNTFTAVNQVEFAGVTVGTGTATVAGSALYNFAGAVGGTGVLAMSGAGTTKTFASTVGTSTVGIGGLRETGGGIVNLRGNVFTSSDSSFAGTVNLRGMAFTTGGLTEFNGLVRLENTGATLQGGGSYQVSGNVEGTTAGSQTLTLAQGGLKTFGGTVGNSVALKGIQQTGGTTAFNNTVRTRGNSTFGGQVELSGMTFDAQVANTSTQFNQGATLNGGAVALGGSGNFVFASDVLVGLDSALAMIGAGANQTFTFAGNVGSIGNLTSLTQTGGKMVVGSGSSATVQTSGNVALANLSTRGAVTVDSGGSDQEFGAIALGGNFTSAADGAVVTYGGVSGSGNMNTTASQLALDGAVRNSGTFAAGQDGAVVLGAGGFLSDTDFANLLSTGGATFTSELGNVELTDVEALTGLTLVSRGGDVVVSGLTSRKSLGIQAFGTADLAGLTQVQSMRLLEAEQLGVDGLDNLDASSLGRVRLTNGGLTYNRNAGGIALQGLIEVSGDVDIRAAGGVINVSGVANPFRGTGSVTLVSPDLYNRNLQNPLIPGARLVRGSAPAEPATSAVAAAAGNGGVTIYYENVNNLIPYSREFTTGTGQPYIFAQQAAIPPVMLPAALTGGNGFAKGVSYSADEIEVFACHSSGGGW
ncbi:hypothetical protein EBS57_06500 [bacterium]|nr:hypothetical protein [bacterium]